ATRPRSLSQRSCCSSMTHASPSSPSSCSTTTGFPLGCPVRHGLRLVPNDWDVASQLTLPTAELKGTADRVIVDPPFLNEDCQAKGAPPHPQSDVAASKPPVLADADAGPPPLRLSCHDRPLALPRFRRRRCRRGRRRAAPPDRVHRRAHGGLGNEVVPSLRPADHRLRSPAREGTEQRVLLLRQL